MRTNDLIAVVPMNNTKATLAIISTVFTGKPFLIRLHQYTRTAAKFNPAEYDIVMHQRLLD